LLFWLGGPSLCGQEWGVLMPNEADTCRALRRTDPINLTLHRAKYVVFELTKRCSSDSIEKLAGALVDAQVDLKPWQQSLFDAQGADR
jgi:hypothetical protein